MRARNIKPGLFLNEMLGTADPMLSLLFIGLWCLADREGRLEDRPLRIKAEVFPYREKVDVGKLLDTLMKFKFIVRYEVSGVSLIEIVNFTKHQNPHHTEKKSVLPSSCDSTVSSPLKDGEYPADSLIPDSLIPDSAPKVRVVVPFEEIVIAYHNLCPSLPKVKALTSDRRKVLAARWKEHGMDDFINLFSKAEASDFLTGRNGGWGGASFDWLLKPGNMMKVLEGNYDNKGRGGQCRTKEEELLRLAL